MGSVATLSTGQAAKLCSVKPNTVLKWIASGKIPAVRTAGGHYRIDRGALSPFISKTGADGALQRTGGSRMACWEFFAKDGETNKGCSSCIVWQSKTERCYVLSDGGRNPDFAGLFCKSSCPECDYYQYATRGVRRILVVCNDPKVRESVLQQRRSDLEIQFACCGYDACCLVRTLRPSLIVIDGALSRSDPVDLYEHMSRDPRCKDATVRIGISGGRQATLPAGAASLPTVELHNIAGVASPRR